jgi:predicted dehydrogenase
MADEIRVALVGIGGYGELYAAELFRSAAQHTVRFVAGVDPFAKRSSLYSEFQQHNIPIFQNLEQLYQDQFADLVIISTPIHLHAPYSIKALENGSYVLCEKPVSGTIQEGLKMLDAQIETGRFIAIGYQWSFSSVISELKKDVQNGLLGQPLSMKTMVLWPRSDQYYHRNFWAGKQKVNDCWVLDSPVNNATSHYLHNSFFVLGTGHDPSSVQAELYRAREIENYDTAALRCITTGGVEVMFYTSHVAQEYIGPVFEYRFSDATVTFNADSGDGLVAHFNDGKSKKYGLLDHEEDHWRKIWESVDAIRSGRKVSCGVADSLAQTICMNGAQESCEEITSFQTDIIQKITIEKDDFRIVIGLKDVMMRCFELGALPAELRDVPWANMGSVINLKKYKQFPSLERCSFSIMH